MAGSDLFEQSDAVQLGHVQVGLYQGSGTTLECGERFDPRSRFFADETISLHQPHEHSAEVRLVIHNEAAKRFAANRCCRYLCHLHWFTGYIPPDAERPALS